MRRHIINHHSRFQARLTNTDGKFANIRAVLEYGGGKTTSQSNG